MVSHGFSLAIVPNTLNPWGGGVTHVLWRSTFASSISSTRAPRGQVARRLLLQRLRAAVARSLAPAPARIWLCRTLSQNIRERSRTCAGRNAGTARRHGWSATGRITSALVEEHALPFPDSAFDRILLVHGLELSEAERPFMRELWRVLTPEGRLLIVAPNRASLWAQFETTPFGHGRPYSRGQLEQLLQRSMFVPERWDVALLMPPMGRRRARSGAAWERLGRRLWRGFAGVHIVEASKSLYALAPARAGAVRHPCWRAQGLDKAW